MIAVTLNIDLKYVQLIGSGGVGSWKGLHPGRVSAEVAPKKRAAMKRMFIFGGCLERLMPRGRSGCSFMPKLRVPPIADFSLSADIILDTAEIT